MEHSVLLFCAGLVAGAINAAAGGGSFLTLPALILAGVPPVAANESGAIALFPGSLASAGGYWEDFRSFDGISMRMIAAATIIGGAVGAALLLLTATTAFDVIIPWLVLMGALAFAFGRQAGAALRRRVRVGSPTLLCGQFLLSVYGGYFGGAVGIMMMALWSLFGYSDIKAMNAAKALMVAAARLIAVAGFAVAGTVWWPQTCLMLVAGTVWWPQTCLMLVAAVLGGYGGARVARRLDPFHLRVGITILNFVIAAFFFSRAFS